MRTNSEKDIHSVQIYLTSERFPAVYLFTIQYVDGTSKDCSGSADELSKKYIKYMSEDDKKTVLEELQMIEKKRLSDKKEEEWRSMLGKKTDTASSWLNMQIVGGFMAVLGGAAIAMAYTVLNASTFGIAGLLVAGAGAVVSLSGVSIGLFSISSAKHNSHDSETLMTLSR